ncbi:addiction module protein [Massilia sp. R2A-15]|uniref:addiction module protein n=1 Tax=Massilia sp. R2A-15 TaxID=3064278 RepID=UPI002737630D|nr:addiction module protein [Massilia sp. R2A-15]WLI89723.1 addiction module protein [Massilia sp. R2A-15]
MSTLVAEIAGKLKLLTSAEKNDLLRLLLLDIEGAEDLDAEEAWRNEIVSRVKAIRNGEAAIKALQEQWHE